MDAVGCMQKAHSRAAEWGQPLLIATRRTLGVRQHVAKTCGDTASAAGRHGSTSRSCGARNGGSPSPASRGAGGSRLGAGTPMLQKGVTKSPACCNHLVAGPLPEANARCDVDLGLSISWSSELSKWSLLVWADSLLVMANTADGLLARCRAYEQALGKLVLCVFGEFLGGAAQCVSSPGTATDAVGGRCLGDSGCASTILDPPRPWSATGWRPQPRNGGSGATCWLRRTWQSTPACTTPMRGWLPAPSGDSSSSAEQRRTRWVAGCRRKPEDEWIPYYRRRTATVMRILIFAPSRARGTEH